MIRPETASPNTLEHRSILKATPMLTPRPRRKSQNPFASIDFGMKRLSEILSSYSIEVNPGTEQNFTLFSNLPVPIQVRIWKCTLPGPRVLELCREQNGYKAYHDLPFALSICKLSRATSKSSYQQLSSHTSRVYFPHGSYANLNTYTLFISQSDRWSHNIQRDLMSCVQISRVRYLAIEVITWIDMMHISSKRLLAALFRMKGLENLTVVWTRAEMPLPDEENVLVDERYVVRGIEADVRYMEV
ncbi:hypothetical protein BKA65DRAFT_510042 [Rhexocercosporidium sp. MPI-PUGE-AT-0058]|nr:hypothetical protein BKA65DRAFT_510042 [Rhexocercosporidium sp. MPI-PUGE-AT-0058]